MAVAIAYACAEATTATLIALYANQTESLKNEQTSFLNRFSTFPADPGATEWGAAVAASILADRKTDGASASKASVPQVVPKDGFKVGEHRSDPTLPAPQLLHAPHWGNVKAFGHQNILSFYNPMPDPWKLDYPGAYELVKTKGQNVTALRTAEETEIGIFWAYEGSFKIGTPHRIFSLTVDAFLAKVCACLFLCLLCLPKQMVLLLQTPEREFGLRGAFL
jgi:hypothetical protein